ncbi:protoporphyrinogen/coproporphyrinogen oxidase [Streptomyces sp. NPDC058548]|uniref:protoporphyrinogen/coproporphyrinogen oxidase n=1 Tax=unclassified Streptomyces TaxID=2593676 RepID=UPI0036668BEC
MDELSGRRVAVIGGGIAGLTAGFRLARKGCQVTVFEQKDHIGGRMRTVERDGYRVDVGASFLSDAYREMRTLIEDAGFTDLVQATPDVIGFVRGGRTHRVRGRVPLDLVRTRLLGWRSKVALATSLADLYRHRRVLDWTDPSQAAALDTEDIVTYARRKGFPDEAIDYLLEPFSVELCMAPAGELSVVNLFFFLNLALGNGFFNSPRGIDFLPKALARDLHVEHRATVLAVENGPAGATVTWQPGSGAASTEQFDGAILALPAHAAAAVYPQFTESQREFLLHGPRYTKGVAVVLGLSQAPAEPAIWLTVPSREHDGLAAVVLDHNKAPGRAPAGKGLLSTYWERDWHKRHYGMDDEAVLDDAIPALAGVFPGLADHVEMSMIHRWDPYAVAWPVGSIKALDGFLRSLDPRARVQLAGDYFSYECTNSSLASGERAAARLAGAMHTGGSR